jgi:hypothetical protein
MRAHKTANVVVLWPAPPVAAAAAGGPRARARARRTRMQPLAMVAATGCNNLVDAVQVPSLPERSRSPRRHAGAAAADADDQRRLVLELIYQPSIDPATGQGRRHWHGPPRCNGYVWWRAARTRRDQFLTRSTPTSQRVPDALRAAGALVREAGVDLVACKGEPSFKFGDPTWCGRGQRRRLRCLTSTRSRHGRAWQLDPAAVVVFSSLAAPSPSQRSSARAAIRSSSPATAARSSRGAGRPQREFAHPLGGVLPDCAGRKQRRRLAARPGATQGVCAADPVRVLCYAIATSTARTALAKIAMSKDRLRRRSSAGGAGCFCRLRAARGGALLVGLDAGR